MILIDSKLPEALLHTTNKIFSGIHYSKRSRIKTDFRWWYKSLKKVPICIDHGPIHLHFKFTFKKRAYDCDNCSFMGKMILDCMVKDGAFKDDSPKYISSITYTSLKNTEDRIIVSIKPSSIKIDS